MELSKPIYIGVCVLELSKLHMHQCYYDVMKKKYGDTIKLLYTDTDSFIFHIETEYFYNDFGDMKEHVDFSGYDTSHPCCDTLMKKCYVNLKMNMMERYLHNILD